ncbi:MAG: carboxypeptidase-like regulatory domain-containing protein [Bacteroidales bacterium]|nr:carboxypeptidase-like regulatory domain-containing protein [Bacteroidales bacterium]
MIKGSLSAQESALYQKISVQFVNITVDSALRVLEKKTHLDFTYNTKLVPSTKKITVVFNATPLAIVLDSLLQKPLVQYRIIDNQLTLYEKNEPVSKETPGVIPSAKTITGKIVDGSTGRALPFSSIGISHQHVGVISNEDGVFIFKIPSKFQNDTLVISHLGYRLYKVPIAEINHFKSYKLQQQVVSLPEILIRSASAPELMRKAILKIPDNYFTGPYRMRSFYREIIKCDNKYRSYTEAILDIYKRPMRPTLYRNEVKVVKERKFNELQTKDTLVFKLKGGIDAILKLDAIRNPLDFLELHNTNYQFALADMQILDNKLVYVIHFSPVTKQEETAFEGDLYIDSRSLAILKMSFGYTKNSLKQLKNVFIVKNSRHFKSYPTEINYDVSYQNLDGKYYIHHILGTIKLKIRQKKKWLASHYSVTFEMIGTDIENKNPIRFVGSEIIKPNRIFSDMITLGETSFWLNENIIPPEADIIKALRKFTKEQSKSRK